jgi:DNA-binding NtrC family response regulator
LNGRIVFIVNEKEETLNAQSAILAKQYQVSTFSTSKALIEALESNKIPDVILVDAEISDIPGIKLVEWVREKELDIPFVIQFESADQSIYIAGLQMEFVELVEKPFPAEILRALVKRAVVTAVRQRLQRGLIEKYQILTESLMSLTRNYEGRVLAAEEELHQAELPPTMSKEEMSRFFAAAQESLVLENVVGSTQDHIAELKVLEKEVRDLLGARD